MPVISVRNLKKQYGAFTAVNGISFDVEAGTVFGLLGSNGAGKTTTLEIIETLKQKDGGTITVGGYDIDRHPQEIRKMIGVQLQASGYFPHLNLKELLELFAGLYNVDVKPMEILEAVQLTDKARSKYKELSGGQKQRFSIATTIIHRPQIIFLDEPTTGLDPQARRQLWEQIRSMKAGGTTVVLTTHYLDEAEYLCDTVAIMDKGRILTMDSPDHLIQQLVDSGFRPVQSRKGASLEDVFIQLTGKEIL
ncbi:MAG: ABC transporter ATP-binding protein [Bacteroidetes bacterium 47-18]|nr:MAG: ABC transporter ATP-binding protein [Bacteroidetes bacterium 47-18]